MQKMEKEGIWSKIEIYCDSEEKQGIYHIYKKIQYVFIMAIRVVEFLNGGYKIRKVFA